MPAPPDKKPSSPLNVLVIGATGNCGRRLVTAGLHAGHTVTVLVRDLDKLADKLGTGVCDRLQIITGDVMDAPAVAGAMAGQDAVINAAGNVDDGSAFAQLIDLVVSQAENVLGENGRLWIFGGAAALDVPGTDIAGVDLPKVPAKYKTHQINYRRLRASNLDWSMICPGPLIPAEGGLGRDDLRISVDIWPFDRPKLTHFLPRIALSAAFAAHVGEMIVTYEDIARVIIKHLAPDGPFNRRRVGLALPQGERGKKPGY